MRNSDNVRKTPANKLGMVTFLVFSSVLFIYTFFLFLTNGNGGIPFVILMVSYAIFFGSRRMYELEIK